MKAKPLNEIRLSWQDHKSVLWWLALLYCKPRIFENEVVNADINRRKAIGIFLRFYVHSLPYMILLNVFNSIFLFNIFVGKSTSYLIGVLQFLLINEIIIIYGIAFGIAVVIAFGITPGITFGITLGITYGITFGIGHGITFGIALGIALGISFGIVHGISPKITEIIVFAISAGIVLGILVGFAGKIFVIIVLGVALGIALGNAFGIAFRIAHGIIIGIVLGIAGGIAFIIIYLLYRFLLPDVSVVTISMQNPKLFNSLSGWMENIIQNVEEKLYKRVISTPPKDLSDFFRLIERYNSDLDKKKTAVTFHR